MRVEERDIQLIESQVRSLADKLANKPTDHERVLGQYLTTVLRSCASMRDIIGTLGRRAEEVQLNSNTGG